MNEVFIIYKCFYLAHQLSRQNVNTTLTIYTILFLTEFHTHALLFIVIELLQTFYKSDQRSFGELVLYFQVVIYTFLHPPSPYKFVNNKFCLRISLIPVYL